MRSAPALLASPVDNQSKDVVAKINDLFVCLAFLELLGVTTLYSTPSREQLLLPLLMLLLSSKETEPQSGISLIMTQQRHLVLPFLAVAVLHLWLQLKQMKTPMARSSANLAYFLLTDRRIRRIREVALFLTSCPTYFSAFCLSRGFFSLNEIFVVVFGLLCIIGLFGETEIVRLVAGVGVVSALTQFLFVKLKERESLKYI